MTTSATVLPWPSKTPWPEYKWAGDPIEPDQLRALSLSAYKDRGAYYVDTLRRDCLHHPNDPTGCSAHVLKNSWGIDDAPGLRRIVGRLLDGMHTVDYEEVFLLAEKAGAAVRDGKEAPKNHSREDHRKYLMVREMVQQIPRGSLLTAYEALYRMFAMNLLTELTQWKYLPRHIRSWDLARVPIVVRSGVTVGMISEAEGWDLLLAALRSAQNEYHDWEMFSDGLVVGRAFWLAQSDIAEVTPGTTWVTKELGELFAAPSSPWQRVTLHP